MIKRVFKNLGVDGGDAPAASTQLERDGYAVLSAMSDADEVRALAAEIDAASEQYPSERSRSDEAEFRYEMFNRSGACQAGIAHSRVLQVVEPLLGECCHVIANTAWDDRIPYPVSRIPCSLLARTCCCGTARRPTARRRPRSVLPAGALRPA